jgi:hypothetical protein
MRRMRQLIAILVAAVTVLALLDQLGRAPADRTWHGRIVGVPYDFRPPTVDRIQERVWNPGDERMLTPHVWGVGWTVNLYQARRRLQLLVA